MGIGYICHFMGRAAETAWLIKRYSKKPETALLHRLDVANTVKLTSGLENSSKIPFSSLSHVLHMVKYTRGLQETPFGWFLAFSFAVQYTWIY